MEARGHEPRAARGGAPVADPRRPGRGRDPASAERTLATSLGISRATVTGAYNRLREQGYVESRQGSGSWVTLPGGHQSAPDAIVGGPGLDMRIAALPAPAALEEVFQSRRARASPLARPPRLRPARPAAPAPGDRRLVRSPRAADAPRADPRHQRRDARARPVDQGGAPARPARARGGPELPGRARRAASRRRPPDAGADDTRGLGPRRAPHGGAESPAGVRVPDAGLPQPHRRAGRRGRAPAGDAPAPARGHGRRDRRDVRRAEPRRRRDAAADGELRRRAHGHRRVAEQGRVGRIAGGVGPRRPRADPPSYGRPRDQRHVEVRCSSRSSPPMSSSASTRSWSSGAR